MRLVGMIMAASVLAAAPAMAAGIPALGRQTAEQWCAQCHVVSADQAAAMADAPSFEDIAARRTDMEALAQFLADPHPVMPDMSLTRQEIANLVAYIGSLR